MNRYLSLIFLILFCYSAKAQLVEYNNKVGIGISQPANKLEIAGTTSLKAAPGAGTEVEQLRFGRHDWDIRYHSIYSIHNGGAENNYLQFRVHGGGASPYLDQNTVMTLFGDGKVGIGTLTPFAKFQISQDATIGSKWNPEKGYLAVTNPNDNGMLIIDPNEIYSNNGLHLGVTTGDIKFRTVNTSSYSDLMVIKGDGSVGIGTSTTGTHKLAVDGTIGAREVKVETGTWSDFVFKEDYKLRSLNEVENYIQQHKHLPDIPSEEEVIENGIELGKMDAKLLQKIEELTLYIIQQQKEIESLKTDFENYKKANGDE